tara:strand:+ start:744 stop:1289 length:546 start_codon:yes stop_codon:yes gene_type:complete
MKSRLQEHYLTAVRPALIEKFGYVNVFEVPRLQKVVINMGVGGAVRDSKKIEHAVNDMTAISGQKPIVTRAKKANAAFKLREGMAIGCKVTLRSDRMYEFLDRLITIALPRVRDFRGLNAKSFDGGGNFALGIKEQIVFPEIEYDKVDEVRGMDVIVVTSAKSDDEARELLRGFQFPFANA